LREGSTISAILELARWAPSGDNTQPWRFQIVRPDHVRVHGFDTRAHCVYDLDGHSSHIALGALLETLRVAATRFGRQAAFSRSPDSPDEKPVFDVHLPAQNDLAEDPLAAYIRERRVHRRPLHTRTLRPQEKLALRRAVGEQFELMWFETWRERLAVAWLNFSNAKIRLTIPEAYRVHRDVIAWGVQVSEDRIPAAAIGASALTLALMRWAMQSWNRVAFLNRYFAGTFAPRFELDLVPALACGAHCAMIARQAPHTVEDYVEAGRGLQRLWLTATKLGLQFQPQYTPIVFARYARGGLRFSQSEDALRRADRIRAALDRLFGPEVAPRAVFIGRLGEGRPAQARSLRLPLERLLLA